MNYIARGVYLDGAVLSKKLMPESVSRGLPTPVYSIASAGPRPGHLTEFSGWFCEV